MAFLTIAQDDFGRTSGSGWGSADVGGSWTVEPSLTVSGGAGLCTLATVGFREALLNGVSTENVRMRVSFSSSSPYSGGAQSFTLYGRYKPASGVYQARVRIEDGLLRLYIMLDETPLVGSTTITHTYVPGEVIWLELEVTGTSPTTVSAKMWRGGTSEPGTWQQTATNSTSAMQSAGTLGLKMQTHGSAASASFAVDNLLAVDPTQVVLATPVVTATSTPPTTVGGTDGTVTATWPAVAGATAYDACLVTGTVTSGFTAQVVGATSPHTFTGKAAGDYTVAVRARS